MVSSQQFREMALAFDDVVETKHFERASFRYNKKIFATLDEKDKLGMLILTMED